MQKRNERWFLYFAPFLLFWIGLSCTTSTQHFVTSPDGKLKLEIATNAAGELVYGFCNGSDTIVAPSRLGFVLSDGDSLCKNLKIQKVETTLFDEVWNSQWGANKSVRNHYQQSIVSVVHESSRKGFEVHFRVFDDGMAFRYAFPENFSTDTVAIADEISEFQIHGNPTAWWSYADFNTYEKQFMRNSLDSVSWAATPLTLRKENGTHLFLHEAAIVKYPDMTLKQMGNGRLKCELTPWKNGIKAYVRPPFSTPWRMLVVSPNAAGLVASSMMLNLNEPSKMDSAQWIKPMTYMGIWWEMHLGSKQWKEGAMQAATTQEAFRYIDFAAENGIPGLVIEGWNTGWAHWGVKDAFDYVTPAQGYDLKKVAAYAQSKGVSLIMHHETGADIEGYEARVDSAFALCKALGIHALKTGYAGGVSTGENHHGQQMVEHYQYIVEKAAEYQLMLDVHEPSKGSGLERTWPNLMTREAVRGMEWEAWSTGNSPSHTTTIPYTRGLAGPTDYTPGILDVLLLNKKAERTQWNGQLKDISKTRVHSTLCHQLALMVTIYSPLQMASDIPENYQGHPAFQFIRDYNADCDQSVVLDGEVGEFIAIARRAGNEWFVGATTNETKRTIELKFDFLPAGKYEATIYQDGPSADWVSNPMDYQIRKLNVESNSKLPVTLASGGGVAIVVKPL